MFVGNSGTDSRQFSARVVSSYCGEAVDFQCLPPYYRDTLQRGCAYTLPLRDRTTHSYPPKGGMTKWHRPPPERGYPPGRRGARLAYTFFQIYSERGQNWFCLKIFLYTQFEIYFSTASQPTCLKIIFLRCVQTRIFWRGTRHKEFVNSSVRLHRHLAC